MMTFSSVRKLFECLQRLAGGWEGYRRRESDPACEKETETREKRGVTVHERTKYLYSEEEMKERVPKIENLAERAVRCGCS